MLQQVLDYSQWFLEKSGWLLFQESRYMQELAFAQMVTYQNVGSAYLSEVFLGRGPNI